MSSASAKIARPWVIRHYEPLLVALLWLAALIYRLYFTYKNYGHVYYDEIYQSKEMAHRWVFGFGHVPWEFRVPLAFGEDGMARSPLHALIYMPAMLLGRELAWSWRSVIQIIQAIDAFAASLIVPCAFYLFKRLFRHPSIYPWLGAAICAGNFWLVYLGVHSFSNIYYAPLFFWSLILLLDVPGAPPRPGDPGRRHFWSGLLLGFAVVLRFDALLFVGLMLIMYYQPPLKSWRQLITNFVGGFLLSGGIISGLIDYFVFGHFWVSTQNSFIYNVILKKSRVHVNEPFGWYFNKLFGEQPALANLFLLASAVMVFELARQLWRQRASSDPAALLSAEEESDGLKLDLLRFPLQDQLRLFLFLIGTLFIISTNPSKQLRFLYPLMPFLFIFLTAAPLSACRMVERWYRRQGAQLAAKNSARLAATFLIAIICAGALLQGLRANAHLRDNINPKLYNDVMRSMLWVGERKDSRGLIVFGDWAMAGGMYHLHKDIPVHYANRDSDREALTRPLLNSSDVYHYNYVIMPRHVMDGDPRLVELLQTVGYRLIHHENKSCFVWRYEEPYLLPEQIPTRRYFPCDEWSPQ